MSYVKNDDYMIIFKVQGWKSCVGDVSDDKIFLLFVVYIKYKNKKETRREEKNMNFYRNVFSYSAPTDSCIHLPPSFFSSCSLMYIDTQTKHVC